MLNARMKITIQVRRWNPERGLTTTGTASVTVRHGPWAGMVAGSYSAHQATVKPDAGAKYQHPGKTLAADMGNRGMNASVTGTTQLG